MIRSLRAETTSIELNNRFGTDSVNGENTEIELTGNKAIFRTTLKPCNSNQKDDVDRLYQESDYGLESIYIFDGQVRDKLEKFLNAYPQVEGVLVELKYTTTKFYTAEFIPIDNDGILFNLQGPL
ncbi:hypothetical protein Q4508_02435 [Amphritea sp. 2_MG-2023]|uniref:hypothetical protein n=1 Tax=Amphritea TaxID=515417 RepID=UPI001C073454|nr:MULTISPECIES: hypothetical protein [Amphritea]MBU2966729.1 hypothetical protein [Amphritea atlantica]MDO6417412.1 hypothetical protein [Amphritea sp. 2_MG-2023]